MRTAADLLDDWALEDDEREWCAQVMESTAAACRPVDGEVADLGLIGATRRLWRRLGDVGVFEFAAEGGERALELVLVCHELGRHRAPGPVAATVMAAGVLDDEKAVTSGEWLVSAGSGSVWPWLPAADATVRADACGLSVAAVVVAEAGRGLSGQPWARATASSAGDAAGAQDRVALGLLANAGYLCGLAERTLDLAVAYAGERRQFGQPILRYQDVGHRLADARAALTASEQLAHMAARTLVAGDASRGPQAAAHASVSAADSAVLVARVAHQTLGAYGFTDESPLAALSERIQEVAVGVPGKGLAREVVRSRPDLLAFVDVTADWLTAEELAFREEVRGYVAARRPADGGAPYFRLSTQDDEAVEATHEELGGKGWLTLGWPAEHGGAGRPPVHEMLLWDALAEARMARPSLGASVVAGALMRYGSDEVKAAFLPGLGGGTLRFALGISEPEAGSDLRNVRLAAMRVDGGYLLQGMKVWTSNAHRATHLLVLARGPDGAADAPGYSVFVVPVPTPGLRVRPLGTFDGGRLNEVFFDDVLVGGDGLVGSPGDGFAVLGAAFEKERHLQFLPGRLRRDLADVAAWLAAADAVPRAVLEHELAPLVDRVAECEATALHLARQRDAQRKPVLAAQHKLRWGETCQAINRLPFDLGIPAAGFAGSTVDRSWRQSFNETIGGGTSEMMRRTIVRAWTRR